MMGLQDACSEKAPNFKEAHKHGVRVCDRSRWVALIRPLCRDCLLAKVSYFDRSEEVVPTFMNSPPTCLVFRPGGC